MDPKPGQLVESAELFSGKPEQGRKASRSFPLRGLGGDLQAVDNRDARTLEHLRTGNHVLIIDILFRNGQRGHLHIQKELKGDGDVGRHHEGLFSEPSQFDLSDLDKLGADFPFPD